MLQSEFYERTKENLTPEEYAGVECLYNAVKMNKDEFCKRWVSVRKNPLFKELAEAYLYESRMHLADANQLQATCNSLREEFDKYKKEKAEEAETNEKYHTLRREDFAKKILFSGFEEEKVYDVIEEEFGIDFIIKAKHEAGVALSDAEIDYMVGKL